MMKRQRERKIERFHDTGTCVSRSLQNKNLWTTLLVALYGIIITCSSLVWAADDFVPTEEEDNAGNSYVLDADDTGGDITLQFGETLGEYLQWNDTLSFFELSDTINIDGNVAFTGEIVDSDGNTGTSGQTLLSDGSGKNVWQDVPGDGSGPPYISTTNVATVEPSASATFSLQGTSFTPTSVVTVPGFDGTVDSYSVVSPTQIDVTVTAGTTETLYDIVVTTGAVANTVWTGNGTNLLEVKTLNWLDLRVGGDAFTHGNGAGNDIRYRTGMTLARDAGGMYFTGSTPWSSWVKFESEQWTRGSNKDISWVFTAPAANMMIGIGSDSTDEASTAQYAQAEVEAYFNNSTSFWGLYGNNGTPGTAGSQGNNITISSSGVYKVVLEEDGDVGDTFTLYQIPSSSPSDWDNVSTVLATFPIGGSLGPNETNIMPFIIPQSGGAQRFLALRVE